jgi:membrane protein YdbS with pleckstrin-like domain
MQCPQCDGEIEADSKFCKHCGARVDADKPQEKPAAPLEEAAESKKKAAGGEKGVDVYRDPRHEKQVWEGRPAWRSYWGGWAVWFLLSIALLIASYRWAGGDSALTKAVWLLAAGAGVVILVSEALYVLGRRYRLTTQRLFVHRGILTRVTDQMELMRVDDVRLRQGVVDRLVNTGSIDVLGTDETDEDVTLESIYAPADVAETLRLHVRGVRTKGTLLVENI